jgi:hypothetical protein
MKRDEFYEAALAPDFPNEIALQVERPADGDPELTFSADALDDLAEQFKTFVTARAFGSWKATGRAPQKLRATVTLDFAPGNPAVDAGPYYNLGDDGSGLHAIDGAARAKAAD